MSKKITIHEAIGEIKKLRKRAMQKNSEASYIGYKKKSADNVANSTMNPENFAKAVQGNYDSVTRLLKNANDIKSKIILSNATTKIKVGEEEMTVAEAIERKKSIEFEEQLLSTMVIQYRNTINTVDGYNRNMEESLDEQVSNLAGKDNSGKNNLTGYMEQYRQQNGWDVIDPLTLKDKIENLRESITDFKNNVDVALSVSNATTFVEIDD